MTHSLSSVCSSIQSHHASRVTFLSSIAQTLQKLSGNQAAQHSSIRNVITNICSTCDSHFCWQAIAAFFLLRPQGSHLRLRLPLRCVRVSSDVVKWRPSQWLAPTPSKRWAELFFLFYSPVWICWALGIVVQFGLYKVRASVGVGVGVCVGVRCRFRTFSDGLWQSRIQSDWLVVEYLADEVSVSDRKRLNTFLNSSSLGNNLLFVVASVAEFFGMGVHVCGVGSCLALFPTAPCHRRKGSHS